MEGFLLCTVLLQKSDCWPVKVLAVATEAEHVGPLPFPVPVLAAAQRLSIHSGHFVWLHVVTYKLLELKSTCHHSPAMQFQIHGRYCGARGQLRLFGQLVSAGSAAQSFQNQVRRFEGYNISCWVNTSFLFACTGKASTGKIVLSAICFGCNRLTVTCWCMELLFSVRTLRHCTVEKLWVTKLPDI